LPKSYKALITAAAEAINCDMIAKYDFVNPPAIRNLVGKGTQLRAFSHEILQASFDAAASTYAEMCAENPKFKKIHDSVMDFRKNAFLWTQVADYGYDNFMMQQQRAGKLG
jgi:TRAP-type mannitol/chloroaromatic compound transport system substrate-binding protein